MRDIHPNSLANLKLGSIACKGKSLSLAHRKAISNANKGKTFSESHKNALSRSRLGMIFSPEHKRNISLAGTGKVLPIETRRKMSQAQTAYWNNAPLHIKEKHGKTSSQIQKSIWAKRSDEERKRLARPLLEGTHKYIKHLSPTDKARISKLCSYAAKRWWHDLELETKNAFLKKRSLKVQIKPSTIERWLINKATSMNWPIKYTGNGDVWIGGKNPDFVNINGNKQVIELFGDYWHKGEDVELRKKHYNSYGFQCLVVWERDIKENKSVVSMIENYLAQGGVK